MSTRLIERPAQRPAPKVNVGPKTHPTSWALVLLLTDTFLFVVAALLGDMAGYHKWQDPRITQHLFIADAIFVLLWILTFDRLGLYRRTFALSIKDELYYTVAALCMGTIPQLVLFTIFPFISTSRIALLYALGFSILLVGGSRAILHGVRKYGSFSRHRRTTIVGTPGRIEAAADSLEVAHNLETQLLAIDNIESSVANINLSQDPDLEAIDWFTKARAWGSEQLILTEILPPHVTAFLLEAAARHRMQVAFAPPRITRYAYNLSIATDGHQALIVPSRLRSCTPRAQLYKRIVDIVLGTVALALLSPVMLLAALAVYLDSGGPVLFRQQRVGAGGRVFNILKFRSMRLDAESDCGAVWASKDDPRKTRVGSFLRRFSIDEMPQLFNVLRGDMSLVGPRPERPVFVELFRTTFPRYDERHLIRPGITGWSQVHMKRVLEQSAAGEKLEYDLQYIENWSLFLDLSVLFQTGIEFLFHRAG